MSNESNQEDLGSAVAVQRDGRLTLSRKKGESILIDGNVTRIELVEIRGKRARLRIVAPKSTRISRSESDRLENVSKVN